MYLVLLLSNGLSTLHTYCGAGCVNNGNGKTVNNGAADGPMSDHSGVRLISIRLQHSASLNLKKPNCSLYSKSYHIIP